MSIENTSLDILNKYFAIATFLMPAIIMITIRRWITPINFNFFHDVYKFIGYGMFNFIVFCIITQICKWDLINDVFTLSNVLKEFYHYLWFILYLPIILGLILATIDRLHIMQYILGVLFRKNIETNGLTAWEEFFAENPCGEINVTLKDGTQIIGDFRKPSRVSSSIEYKDLWICKVVRINNHCFNKDASIWINGNDIKYIVLNKHKEKNRNSLLFELLSNIFKSNGLIYSLLKDISEKVSDIAETIKRKEFKNGNKSE